MNLQGQTTAESRQSHQENKEFSNATFTAFAYLYLPNFALWETQQNVTPW